VKTIRTANADSRIALLEFAGAPAVRTDFSATPADLDAAIGRLFPNQHAGAVLLDALDNAGARLAKQPPPRRAVVSVDFNSPEFSAEKSMKPTMESLHKAGATVWAVTVRGTSVTTPIRETVLSEAAKASGGQRLSTIDASGLEAVMKTIANCLSSQYVITFVRSGGRPKVMRVETTRGVKVLVSPFVS
jgi:hypothetical protein